MGTKRSPLCVNLSVNTSGYGESICCLPNKEAIKKQYVARVTTCV